MNGCLEEGSRPFLTQYDYFGGGRERKIWGSGTTSAYEMQTFHPSPMKNRRRIRQCVSYSSKCIDGNRSRGGDKSRKLQIRVFLPLYPRFDYNLFDYLYPREGGKKNNISSFLSSFSSSVASIFVIFSFSKNLCDVIGHV